MPASETFTCRTKTELPSITIKPQCTISENTRLHKSRAMYNKTCSLQSGSSRHWRGCSNLRAYASNWREENSMWLHCAEQPTCTFIQVQGSKFSLKHLCCCVFKVTSLLLSMGHVHNALRVTTALKCMSECTAVSVKYVPSGFSVNTFCCGCCCCYWMNYELINHIEECVFISWLCFVPSTSSSSCTHSVLAASAVPTVGWMARLASSLISLTRTSSLSGAWHCSGGDGVSW